MLVYRIEDKKRRGAYNATACDNRRTAHGCFDARDHPPPGSDGMPMKKLHPHHHFGFASLRDVVRWFPKSARRGMVNHGTLLGLSVYEVHGNAVLRGNKQVAFNRHKAKRVSFRLFKTGKVTS